MKKTKKTKENEYWFSKLCWIMVSEMHRKSQSSFSFWCLWQNQRNQSFYITRLCQVKTDILLTSNETNETNEKVEKNIFFSTRTRRGKSNFEILKTSFWHLLVQGSSIFFLIKEWFAKKIWKFDGLLKMCCLNAVKLPWNLLQKKNKKNFL